MKLLLDTHIFIWLATEPGALPVRARTLCHDLENELLLSIASIWEMQIKHQLGKLNFVTPLTELIATQCSVNGIALRLSIRVDLCAPRRRQRR